MRQKQLLEQILTELRNIHYHVERIEVFYQMAHNIKENDKGVWVEDKKEEVQKK